MRTITYAGEAVHTSDEVASLVVELAAELAKAGRAEAIEIPIVTAGGGRATAELVVGVGNDVLSLPYEPDEEADGQASEPEFPDAAEMLTAMLDAVLVQFTAPTDGSSALAALSVDALTDPELERDAAPDPVPDVDGGADDAQVTSLDAFRRTHRAR